MEGKEELNLYDVPLLALRPPTREVIVCGLHEKKILPSDEKLPRDWRGLAHLAGLPSPTGDNPVSQLLTAWETVPKASLGQLEQYLGQLDRWDIVDDLYSLIRKDATEFLKRTSGTSTSCAEVDAEIDKKVLTFDDISRLQQGLELQVYDALLLYADEDLHFAQQMVKRLEHAGCKICLKDSLVAGLTFEHQGVMRLISERCRRVIIIVSRNFIDSNANRFFVLYAQAMSIERDRRIIIPCIYGEGPIEMPMEIKHIFKLDFNRTVLPNYDFWGQLEASVTNPLLGASPVQTRPSLTIRELSRSIENLEHPTLLPPINNLKSAQSMVSIADHKRSCSQLSVSTHNSDDSVVSVKEKRHKLKLPKAIFRNIFKSKKQPKQQIAIAVEL